MPHLFLIFLRMAIKCRSIAGNVLSKSSNLREKSLAKPILCFFKIRKEGLSDDTESLLNGWNNLCLREILELFKTSLKLVD